MDWRVKVGIQFVLAHAPGGRRANYAFQRLRRSHTAEVVRRRIPQLASSCAWMRAAGVRIQDAVVLEIGTGWDAIQAMLLHALGARCVHTYDVTRLLRRQLVHQAAAGLEAAADMLAAAAGADAAGVRERLARLRAAPDPRQVLASAGIHYHAPQDAAATQLADDSVDLAYSYEVLEHVSIETAERLHGEIGRVLRPGGHVFHKIDHLDHYATFDRGVSTVNFLQFSDRWWNRWIQNSISYHNRLREREFLDIFARAGFEVAAGRHEVDPGALRALERLQLDARFARFTPEELAVARSEHVLRRAV